MLRFRSFYLLPWDEHPLTILSWMIRQPQSHHKREQLSPLAHFVFPPRLESLGEKCKQSQVAAEDLLGVSDCRFSFPVRFVSKDPLSDLVVASSSSGLALFSLSDGNSCELVSERPLQLSPASVHLFRYRGRDNRSYLALSVCDLSDPATIRLKMFDLKIVKSLDNSPAKLLLRARPELTWKLEQPAVAMTSSANGKELYLAYRSYRGSDGQDSPARIDAILNPLRSNPAPRYFSWLFVACAGEISALHMLQRDNLRMLAIAKSDGSVQVVRPPSFREDNDPERIKVLLQLGPHDLKLDPARHRTTALCLTEPSSLLMGDSSGCVRELKFKRNGRSAETAQVAMRLSAGAFRGRVHALERDQAGVIRAYCSV